MFAAEIEGVLMAKIRARRTGQKWAFQCAKKGHTPSQELPRGMNDIGGVIWMEAVCAECGCLYMTKMGKASPIVTAGGKAVPHS